MKKITTKIKYMKSMNVGFSARDPDKIKPKIKLANPMMTLVKSSYIFLKLKKKYI